MFAQSICCSSDLQIVRPDFGLDKHSKNIPRKTCPQPPFEENQMRLLIVPPANWQEKRLGGSTLSSGKNSQLRTCICNSWRPPL
jgi:hypothetical protein